MLENLKLCRFYIGMHLKYVFLEFLKKGRRYSFLPSIFIMYNVFLMSKINQFLSPL